MESTQQHSESKELMQLEFDHAWKYFELHANQRITLFRFYIIFLSLFTTGMIFLIIRFPLESIVHECSAIFISLFFIAATIIFWFLDTRNKNLIHHAEEALRKLEDNHFYKCDKDTKADNLQCKEINKFALFNIENTKTKENCDLLRHTFCFRAIYTLAIIMACCFIGFSLYCMSYYECHPETVQPMSAKVIYDKSN